VSQTTIEPRAIPMLGAFVIAVFLLVRSREVRPWVALVIFLCGALVGTTSYLHPIVRAVNWLATRIVGGA
jgi:hypothetical protein